MFRLGMDQDHLKTIVNDILDMDSNNKWEVTTNTFIRWIDLSTRALDIQLSTVDCMMVARNNTHYSSVGSSDC